MDLNEEIKGLSLHPQKSIKAKKAVYECDDIFLDGAENLHRAQLQRLGTIINGVFSPILETDNNGSGACGTQEDVHIKISF